MCAEHISELQNCQFFLHFFPAPKRRYQHQRRLYKRQTTVTNCEVKEAISILQDTIWWPCKVQPVTRCSYVTRTSPVRSPGRGQPAWKTIKLKTKKMVGPSTSFGTASENPVRDIVQMEFFVFFCLFQGMNLQYFCVHFEDTSCVAWKITELQYVSMKSVLLKLHFLFE